MEIFYLIYVLAFILGSIGGLLLSYKKHMEPFIISEIDVLYLVLSLIGWILLINHELFSKIIPPVGSISVGLFLIGLVIGARPGYGRKETVIGAIVAIIILVLSLFFKFSPLM